MKAITFLEWIFEAGKKFVSNEYSYKDYLIHIGDKKNFYSQPFRPEMITELFEGWIKNDEKSFISNEINKNQPYFKISFFKEPRYEIEIRNVNYETLVYSKIPQILNDFISDCNRAGIDLEWKPEIVKGIFG